jgi:hypothetical protein
MKKLLRPLIGVAIFVACVGGLWMTRERDPAFQPYLTTFDGKPAVGQLHRDGWYSFHYTNPIPHSDKWRVGSLITSLPSGEAAKLH